MLSETIWCKSSHIRSLEQYRFRIDHLFVIQKQPLIISIDPMSSSSSTLPNSDNGSFDRLVSEWRVDYSKSSDDSDPLLHMYEFARRSLLRRDGFIPSFNCSRRASVDSGSLAVPDVIRQVADNLKKENESVTSFIKEWIDSSDDPHGMILESSPLTSMSPISSSSNPRSSISGGTPKTYILLSTLIDWDNDFLAFTGSELVSRSIKIFDSWGFFDASLVLLPELTQDGGGSVAPSPQSLPPLVKHKDKFFSFIKSVAKNYRASNAYHNFHHAHSVLAIVGNMLRNCTPNWFTQLEEFSILTAAICHDVGHRGLNSDYYIKTKHELAIQYNDISVLENMHCSLSFDLLLRGSNNFTSDWSEEQFSLFRKIFIQSVLSTDMKQHFELTSKLVEIASNSSHNGSPCAILPNLLNAEEKKTVFTSIVHAADLANPTMSTKACYDWAFRVVEEMYAQGKLEEKGGFAVAPFMKHPPTHVNEFAKLQISFVGYIVSPLWKAMAAIWPTALNDKLEQIDKNNKFWEDMRDRSEKAPE